jgi:hypothetical protein
LSGENVEVYAKEVGFVQRESLINGNRFLELLLLNCTKGILLSLEDLAREFELLYGQTISKQGVDNRFNPEAVLFLKSILDRLMEQQLNIISGSDKEYRFTACRLKDSTRFRLPDSYSSVYKGHGGATNTKSMISIQYEYDLLTGNYMDLQLTSGCRNDQRDSNESVDSINEGELLIRDLGYITTTYLSKVSEKKAFFLNRYPTQMNVYDVNDENKQIDFEKIHKKLKRYNLPYIELDVLLGKEAQIPCRLVVSLCEEMTAKKRLKKTTKNTKSTGNKVSRETKIKSKLNMYITNAPVEMIDTKDIYQIYTLRWQIELIFKAWKSICSIDKIKEVKLPRFECILLSGMIWALANWKVFQLANNWLNTQKTNIQTLSIWKYFRFVSSNHIRICSVFYDKEKLDEWLIFILDMAQRKLIRETKKHREPHIDRLNRLKISLA